MNPTQQIESRPGYKMTKLGWIPVEWEVTKIDEVAKLINGRGFKPHEWKEEGIPIIRIQNLNGSNYFNYYQGDYNPKIVIENGQLLFAWSGSKGTSFGPHVWNGERGLLNYHTWKVDFIADKIQGSYFLHTLRYLTTKIEEKAHGASALVHTQKGEMEKFPLLLPPLPEQRAIAKILSTWDKAIDTLRQLITAHQQRKKGLMQQLLTGKTRLKGFEGEWKEVEMSEVFERVRRVNQREDEEIEVFTISAKNGFLSQKDRFNRVIAGSSLKKYTLLLQNEFSYNKGNSITYPYGCIYKMEENKGLVPFVYISFRAIGKVDEDFYKQYFSAGGLERQLKKIITSGARSDGLLNVSVDGFFKLKTVLPPLREQTAIANILQTADKEIEILEKKLSALQQQKKGLMQVLLTGEVRVKGIENQS